MHIIMSPGKNVTILLEKFKEKLFTEGLSFNSIKSYLYDIKFFNFFLEKNSTNEENLDNIIVKKYFHYIFDKKKKISTIKRTFSSIKKYLTFLKEQNKINLDLKKIVHLSKKEKNIPKILSKEEMSNLFDFLEKKNKENNYFSARNLFMLQLLYATGIRVTELVSLRIPFKIREEKFLLIKGKGDKERIIPLTENIKKLIFNYHKIHKKFLSKKKKLSKWAFPSIKNFEHHISRQRFFQVLSDLSDEIASNKKIHPHMIRHTTASHLLWNGLNLRFVQTLLGHTNISTTEIYTSIPDKLVHKTINEKHPLEEK